MIKNEWIETTLTGSLPFLNFALETRDIKQYIVSGMLQKAVLPQP
jgi:hypothetical protein